MPSDLQVLKFHRLVNIVRVKNTNEHLAAQVGALKLR